MTEWIAFLLVALGGVMHGTYFLGLKYVNPWKWENIWALYAMVALIVLPVGLALGTVPHLGQVFALAPGGDLLRVFLYGAGWGVGSVLCGLGVERMGMAMGVAVVIGVTAALGSFVPLVANTPELVLKKKGMMVILAVVTLLLGVTLTAVGGKKREQSQAAAGAPAQHGGFGVGLTVCIFSGIFSSMLNYAFAFSQSVVAAARQSGASDAGALNVVWMIALGPGFIANGAYTAYLLSRNKTWGHYALPGTTRFWFYGLAMGVIWTFGVILYGRGAAGMGQLGSVIGWPLFMATAILVSSVWGFITGEWKGSSTQAKQFMLAGLAVLIVASALLGIANQI